MPVFSLQMAKWPSLDFSWDFLDFLLRQSTVHHFETYSPGPGAHLAVSSRKPTNNPGQILDDPGES